MKRRKSFGYVEPASYFPDFDEVEKKTEEATVKEQKPEGEQQKPEDNQE